VATEPSTDEEKRARKASANRVLTYLKAALNHAYKEGDVKNREAWDIKLEPFAKVDAPRERYLKVDEAARLINACTPDFRPLVQAALETGCRYGELTRMRMHDFNADSATLHVQQSKSGKSRDVVLSAAGADFFRRHCLGRAGHDWMFVHRDGTAWGKSDQSEPMRNAVERARISPPISFHGLRHTWASLAVMNHMPLMVVAKNLGHRDTRMVEHHHGHLAKSFVADAIRAHAPVVECSATSSKSRPIPRRISAVGRKSAIARDASHRDHDSVRFDRNKQAPRTRNKKRRASAEVRFPSGVTTEMIRRIGGSQ
jgi:integrase